ncbi:MAG: hypothetical protein PHC91_07985 [Eubacteriales bacterium]|nr:hypothetical protein [Eubacteriales bacterium]
MGSKKKGGELENNTKDNPYDNYHGHQQSGQSLQSSKSDTNKDPNSTGKDPKNKRHKNK